MLSTNWFQIQLETVSIAEPLPNRQHARKTPNAVNTREKGKQERRKTTILGKFGF